MTDSTNCFRLLFYLRADLCRQQALMQGLDKCLSTGFILWMGIISPRFTPVLLCRLAHWFFLLGLSPIAKLVSLINFFLFGIEIAVRCPIGPGLFFPHTQGTVIGAWSIGSNATIFQGVTVGAKEIDFSYSELGRPIICNDVTIGSGAKVLGGITLGNGSRIGANSVVLRSVPSNSLAVGAPAKVVSGALDDPNR